MDRWIGKTAVVTGAASGIGEAITRALLRKGVNVVALDIQKEKLASLAEWQLTAKEREGFSAALHPIHCDVSVEKDIDAAFQQIDAYGGVDIMVNNAGVMSYRCIIGMSYLYRTSRIPFKR
jgi:NAD(P)-dependent dehydrogenase (short-subunit alcohol dehydrogenase family)